MSGGGSAGPLSGEQVELACGDARAVITTVGATLRTCVLGERVVVDGFDADEVCPSGRGQVLMPWPNRVAEGCYRFAGREHRLPVDERARGHAIHGLVRWEEWQVVERSVERAVLHHRLCARPGYPFPLALSVEYRLSERGLAVTLGAVNIGGSACPFGAGAHPYFALPGVRADQIELTVRAAEWIETDERSIPIGHRPVAESRFDFRTSHPIGGAQLDHAFTGLQRDGEGRAEILLAHGRDRIALWQDRAFGFAQIFTGDALPDQARRRLGVAVEPMTCAPNAFNSGDGLLVLAPGESFTGRFGFTVS